MELKKKKKNLKTRQNYILSKQETSSEDSNRDEVHPLKNLNRYKKRKVAHFYRLPA